MDITDELGDAAWAGDGQHLVSNRLTGCYHSGSGSEYKQLVVDTFPKEDTNLRCLVSTVAFGMGVDIPDVQLVIHWMPSCTVLSYWQEVGRCGRNGESARALLYMKPTGNIKVDNDMKEACKSFQEGQCMRMVLLKHFLLPAMGKDPLKYLKDRKACPGGCSPGECICPHCLCCSNCKSNCKCSTA